MEHQKHVEVTKKSPTGRNFQFRDNFKNISMSKTKFVREIKYGI